MAAGDYLPGKGDLLRGDIFKDVLVARTTDSPRTFGSRKNSAHLHPDAEPNHEETDPFEIRRLTRVDVVVFSRSCHIEHPDGGLGKRNPVLAYRVLRISDNHRKSLPREHLGRDASLVDLVRDGLVEGYYRLDADEQYGVSEGFVYFWEPYVLDASEFASGTKLCRLSPFRVIDLIGAQVAFERMKLEDFEDDDPADQIESLKAALSGGTFATKAFAASTGGPQLLGPAESKE